MVVAPAKRDRNAAIPGMLSIAPRRATAPRSNRNGGVRGHDVHYAAAPKS